MLDNVEHPRAAGPIWRIAGERGWAVLRLVLALAAGATVLAGCALAPDGQIMSQGQAEERIPLRPVPVSQAWISPADMQIVLQRELGFGSEQRISLRNRTLVPGDNLILLRTRSGMRTRGSLRFDELMRRVGEMPAPFEDVGSGELITASDEMGDYLWTEKRFGSDTVCVLGVRRVDSGMRQIPGGDAVMDVVLRNCVAGTAEQALQPMLAASIGNPSVAQTGADESRLISPLAGPTMP